MEPSSTSDPVAQQWNSPPAYDGSHPPTSNRPPPSFMNVLDQQHADERPGFRKTQTSNDPNAWPLRFFTAGPPLTANSPRWGPGYNPEVSIPQQRDVDAEMNPLVPPPLPALGGNATERLYFDVNRRIHLLGKGDNPERQKQWYQAIKQYEDSWKDRASLAVELPNKRWQCNFEGVCEFEGRTLRDNLIPHIASHFGMHGRWFCTTCEKTFGRDYDRDNHQKKCLLQPKTAQKARQSDLPLRDPPTGSVQARNQQGPSASSLSPSYSTPVANNMRYDTVPFLAVPGSSRTFPNTMGYTPPGHAQPQVTIGHFYNFPSHSNGMDYPTASTGTYTPYQSAHQPMPPAAYAPQLPHTDRSPPGIPPSSSLGRGLLPGAAQDERPPEDPRRRELNPRNGDTWGSASGSSRILDEKSYVRVCASNDIEGASGGNTDYVLPKERLEYRKPMIKADHIPFIALVTAALLCASVMAFLLANNYVQIFPSFL